MLNRMSKETGLNNSLRPLNPHTRTAVDFSRSPRQRGGTARTMRTSLQKSLQSFSLLSAALALLAALVAAGCNDDPSSVGSDFLPQNVEFKTIDLPLSEFTIQSGIAQISNGSNDGNDAVLVGQAADGTIAHGLLALTNRADRLRNISGPEIVKAELRLRTFNYRYGDTASRQVNFDVTSIEGVFGSSAKWNPELVGKIEGGNVLGTYDGAYPDSTIIAVELDRDRTAEFLGSYFELDTIVRGPGDTTVEQITRRTLALRATQGSSMIGSFLGASLLSLPDSVRPTLRITLPDTTIDLTMGVSSWIAQLPSSLETGADRIVVAGGAPVRTLIKFRLDSIPAGAIIHRAELTLHIVPESQQRGTTGVTQRVVAYVAGDNPLGTEKYLATFPEDLGQIFLRGARPARDESSFEDYILFSSFGTTLTQWLRAERGFGNTGISIPNNGLLLALDRTSPSLETGTVDRMSFYGPDAPEGLRPQLRIVYSTQVNA